MKMRSLAVLAAGAVTVAGLALLAAPHARSQINTAPSWVPIGVSASGNASTAWFHEPSTRQAVACQTVAGSGAAAASIHCVATRLP